MSGFDIEALFHRKCITEEILEKIIYDYYGIHPKIRQSSEYAICFGGFYENDILMLYFIATNPEPLWDSTILQADFYGIQLVCVEIEKTAATIELQKEVLDFYFFLKSRLPDCGNMLITEIDADVCFIHENEITWSPEVMEIKISDRYSGLEAKK